MVVAASTGDTSESESKNTDAAMENLELPQ
jgi:hypothetical protein